MVYRLRGTGTCHAKEAMEHFVEDDYNPTPDILLVSAAAILLFREQAISDSSKSGMTKEPPANKRLEADSP